MAVRFARRSMLFVLILVAAWRGWLHGVDKDHDKEHRVSVRWPDLVVVTSSLLGEVSCTESTKITTKNTEAPFAGPIS